jgi:UDP-N-acetylglucosamine 4-epimerase
VPRSIEDPSLACHEANVTGFVNLPAATTDNPTALNQVYNVAVAERATLNELFRVREGLGKAMGWYLRSLSRQA